MSEKVNNKMNLKNLLLIILTMGLSSCAFFTGMSYKEGLEALGSSVQKYRYEDKGNDYNLELTSQYVPTKATYSVKRVMRTNDTDNKVVEQSVAIASTGVLKNSKMEVLKPKISQFNIWFDGQKYASEIKVNEKTRKLEIKKNSPEDQWNGLEEVDLPSGQALPCYFSQVMDCAKVTGFTKKASRLGTGSMNIVVIWEGYPYIADVYSNFPAQVYSSAELVFDGNLSSTERRFLLNVNNQEIVYILNNKDELVKSFWISQGVTMMKSNLPRESH